jgi:predicted phage-related endonuclease
MSAVAEAPAITKHLTIGARDAAAICGLDEHRTAFDVWAEKRGDLARDPAGAAAGFGSVLELPLGRWYEVTTGREVYRAYRCSCGADVAGIPMDPGKFGTTSETFDHEHDEDQPPAELRRKNFRHPSIEWAVAQPDFLVEEEQLGVECKVVGARFAYDWPQPEEGQSTILGQGLIPRQPWAQVQWGMLVLGYDRWDVVALLGGTLPVIYPVDRDEKAVDMMLDRVDKFVRDNLIGDTRPELSGGRVVEYLRAHYDTYRPTLAHPTGEALETIRRFRAAARARKVCDEAYEALKPSVMEIIGDAEGAEFDLDDRGRREKVYWRKGSPRRKVDWEGIANVYGSTCPDFQQTVEDHTETIPAERVLRPVWAKD